jgi:hypothetical protein
MSLLLAMKTCHYVGNLRFQFRLFEVVHPV